MRNLRKSVDAENSDDGPSLDAVVRIKCFLQTPAHGSLGYQLLDERSVTIGALFVHCYVQPLYALFDSDHGDESGC